MMVYPYYLLTCTEIREKKNLICLSWQQVYTSVDAVDADYSHKNSAEFCYNFTWNFWVLWRKNTRDWLSSSTWYFAERQSHFDERKTSQNASNWIRRSHNNSYGIFIQTYTHTHTYTCTSPVCSAFIGDGATIIHTVFPYQNTILSLSVYVYVCVCVRGRERHSSTSTSSK